MKTAKISILLTGILVFTLSLLFFPAASIQEPAKPKAGIGNAVSLNLTYQKWKYQQEQRPDPGALPLSLGWSKGLSAEFTRAGGTAVLDLESGKVDVKVENLPENVAGDVWLIDNRPAPGGSVRPEDADDILYLGRLNQTSEGVASLHVLLDPNTLIQLEIDMVVVTRKGMRPEEGGLLYGMPSLFQRLYSKSFRRQELAVNQHDEDGVLALGPADAYAAEPQSSAAVLATLVADGEDLFFNETFNGNGRTCGTCHPAENNFTLDPAFIATLPGDDPLFVAEFNPDLNFATNGGLRFENPTLMREFGLILENVDGFEDLANKFTMRSVSHVFAQALSITPSTRDGSDLSIVHRTGWSGDGAPDSGSLRDFAVGAVVQHTPKTLARVEGVDFRLPTDEELDALEAFQLSLGRQEELDLGAITFLDADIAAGEALFLGQGKCNRCHGNGGAIVSTGPNKGANANIDTGVEDFPHPTDALGELRPRDGGFGVGGSLANGFGDGTFNIPSVIEAADTPPFFHNNAVSTLEDVVSFYGSDEFANSPGSAEVNGITLNNTFVKQIADFLRALNTLENIRVSLAFAETAKLMSIEDGKKPLQQMWEDTDDAVRILVEASILGQTRGQMKKALSFIELAQNETNLESRDFFITKAIIRLNAGRDALATFASPASASSMDNARNMDTPAVDEGDAEAAMTEDATETLPERFGLHQNFPNPFNPTTEIGFTLRESGQVRISVFDSIGREVRVLADETYEAGEHRVSWDGRDQNGRSVATGAYLYQLSAGNQTFTRTMALVK